MGKNTKVEEQNKSDSAKPQGETARKKLDWKSIVTMVIGGIILVLCLVLFIVGSIKPESCIANLKEVFFVVMYISLLCVVLGFVQLIFAWIAYEKINCNYDFDYNLELAGYKKIGKIEKYHNYMEWKEHIKEVCPKQVNCCNFYRFMNRRLRNAKASCEFLTAIYVPFQVGLIPIFFTFTEEGSHVCCLSFTNDIAKGLILLFYVAAMVLMVFLFLKTYLDLKDEIHFAEDVMNIVEASNDCDTDGKK